MKKLALLFLVALLSGPFNVWAFVTSYLRFEEGSGWGAYDQTGLMDGGLLGFSDVSPGGGDTGHQGWSSNVASPTIPHTGEANTGSIRYAGGEYINLSNGNALSLGTAFTIELFFYSEDPGRFGNMFGFSPLSTLYFSFNNLDEELYFSGEFQGFRDSPIFDPTIQADQWYHLAFVKEPGEYSLYIDGDLLFNGGLPSGTDGPYYFPGSGISGDRYIGSGFRGYLDEFRISDEALMPSQFLNASIPEPGTFGLLGFGLIAFAFRKKP